MDQKASSQNSASDLEHLSEGGRESFEDIMLEMD